MRLIGRTIGIILLVLALQAASVVPLFAQQAQVQEAVLPNGLKVLTKEVRAAPVVSFMVWYKVGSRNEQLGKTGLSHLLEHMQFKGTETFKKGEADKLISKNGGTKNAATWKDFTYYYETLPSDKLELAVRIEADRMVNSLIDAKEHEAEMTVVRSELEGNENNPDRLMMYELYAAAYKAHPYQWPTIGWRHDVESITRDDIWNYYRTFYHPNNATVVIVGDFDTGEALKLVQKHFGLIPRGPEPPEVTAKEPPQLGERRAVIRKAGASHRIMMGFHTPEIGHPDIYPLDVLELVLSGGRSARLYKALVDGQLATSAWASAGISRDANLFRIGATARDGVSIEDVETALLEQVERVKSEQISDEELQKALNQLEAQFVYANDSITDQADQLGYFETIHSWRFIDEYLEHARKVTREDVQRVAQTYLTEVNRTVVTFIPMESKSEEQEQARGEYRTWLPEDMAAYQSAATAQPSAPKSEIKPTRIVLPNGMVVIVHENRSNPTVAVTGSLNAGGFHNPRGKSGVADITAGLLTKGTARRTADQIAYEKDFVGMSLEASAQTERASFSGRALTKDFDLLLDHLSDILRNPTFPEDEFNKWKARRLSGTKQEVDSPRALAYRKLYGSVFPKDHPYHLLSVDEELQNTSAITREDVVEFHRKHYGPESLVLVVVGDVDAQEVADKVKSHFGEWRAGNRAKRPTIPETPISQRTEKLVIPMPDKSQVDVLLGYSGGLKRSDPDFYAAMIMNYVLGGGGALDSRMGDVIRDEMGLVYNVFCTFDLGLGAGPWYSYLGTGPQSVDKAVEVLLEQIELMRNKGITEEEMRDAVSFLTGSFAARRLETNGMIADTLHQAEIYGMGMSFIQDYAGLYQAVTLEEVNQSAKKYLHPDKYTLVIAGPYEP